MGKILIEPFISRIRIKALQTLGVEIDQDTKAHILAGDRDMIIDLLENIYKHCRWC